MTAATTVKRPRTKYAVDHMSEGDWIVRGTMDPSKALELIVDVMNEEPDTDDMLTGVSPEIYAGKRFYGDLDPEAVADMGDYLFGLLERARPGLYRKIHCLPGSDGEGEGWGWELGYAKERGPGVFEGVYLPS